MHWIALLLFAATALCAGVWVLIRAALANLSNLSARYPCLPRRVDLTPTRPTVSAREARRRALQRAKTIEELRDLARPQ
jgi:hypothetical protein